MFADDRVAQQFHIRGDSALVLACDAVWVVQGRIRLQQVEEQLHQLRLQCRSLIFHFAVAHERTKSLWRVLLCVGTRCASMHQESSDDDVVAMVHKALPKETVLVDKKEHCMLCEQQFDFLARARSKYSVFAVKPLHNAFYKGPHSLKRTCDKDKPGNLFSRLTSCRAKDSEYFKESGLAMVDKKKYARTTTQRETAVSMLESTTSSLTVKRTRGLLLLTNVAYIKHQNEHEATLEDRP